MVNEVKMMIDFSRMLTKEVRKMKEKEEVEEKPNKKTVISIALTYLLISTAGLYLSDLISNTSYFSTINIGIMAIVLFFATVVYKFTIGNWTR